MPEEKDEWAVWRVFVIEELKRLNIEEERNYEKLNSNIRQLESKINDIYNTLDSRRNDVVAKLDAKINEFVLKTTMEMQSELRELKIKTGFWGGAALLLAAIGMILWEIIKK
jgi:dsDNA-specific endonuclease/ATPase MutS2